MTHDKQAKCGYGSRSVQAATAVLVAAFVSGLAGCGGTGVGTQSDPASDPAVDTQGTPSPVASLNLATGQVIEFYDFDRAALIVETGEANMAPALNRKGAARPDELVDIWTRLAPEQAVPEALSQLQERLVAAEPTVTEVSPDSAIERASAEPSSEIDGEKQRVGRAAVGCNNGCCDATWLSTFAQCQGGWDYNWFLYNYGWTTASSTHDVTVDTLVCSAQGTSTFSISVGGSGGTWSVPEASYRIFNWAAAWNFFTGNSPKNMSSSVNSSTNSHLHTYCGGIWYN